MTCCETVLLSVFAVVDVVCYFTLIRRSWHETVFSGIYVADWVVDALWVADFFDCALPRAVSLCWFLRAGGISEADGLLGYFSVFMSDTCSLHV